MRKQALKRVSSVPPFSPFGIDISRTTEQLKQLSSLPKEKRNKDEFNQDIAAWLPLKDNRGWQLVLEKFSLGRGPRLKLRVALIENGSIDLWKLYLRYGILPACILNMLEAFVMADWSFDYLTWNRLRSGITREKDAKILDKARLILEQYWAYLPNIPKENPFPNYQLDDEWNVYPSGPALEWIAKQIRDLFPSQRHKPKHLILILFARELSEHFFSLTGRPLYEHVGNLFVATFPHIWHPTGEIKEAAKKLVKAANGAKDDLRYIANHIVGNFDHVIRMSDEYWGKKRKQVDKQLKASMARRPRKARGG